MSAPRRYRLVLALVLVLSLLACAYVGLRRVAKERAARGVEIAMDYGDFLAFARAYGYKPDELLVQFRRAGLSSVGVAEELGGQIDASRTATLYSGQQLIDQHRLAPLGDPLLATLARTNRLDPDELYLAVYDPAALARYERTIALHFGPHGYRVLRDRGPALLAVRSQLDYFDALGFGMPESALAQVRAAGLVLDPRVQNDERFGAAQIDRTFASFAYGGRVGTVIFAGARNEVLGYPDHLPETAAAFKRARLTFGVIETYDKNQVQKGGEGLATLLVGESTRVQAISKLEQDKLKPAEIVARYLLGVRERNVRVVYLRPYLHPIDGLSPEATNVRMIKAISESLAASGFETRRRGGLIARADGIPAFAVNPLVVLLASLAVPAMLLLLLEWLGVRRPRLAYALFGADVLVVALGYAAHHDIAARKLVALAGALVYATAAVVAIARAFATPEPRSLAAGVLAGLRTLGTALLVSLGGALVVVGLLSTPLLMEEIDRFTGVKLVILVPPIAALAIYLFTRRFRSTPLSPLATLVAPVRAYQILAVGVLAIAGGLYVMRSGNQSEIAPSSLELALRHGLAATLGVRPRFKEFALGFPLLMLLPSLRPAHRAAAGWIFVLGIAIGTADVVDTFSHLHTPLAISLVRVIIGALVGIGIGVVAIALYRACLAALAARGSRMRAP